MTAEGALSLYAIVWGLFCFIFVTELAKDKNRSETGWFFGVLFFNFPALLVLGFLSHQPEKSKP